MKNIKDSEIVAAIRHANMVFCQKNVINVYVSDGEAIEKMSLNAAGLAEALYRDAVQSFERVPEGKCGEFLEQISKLREPFSGQTVLHLAIQTRRMMPEKFFNQIFEAWGKVMVNNQIPKLEASELFPQDVRELCSKEFSLYKHGAIWNFSWYDFAKDEGRRLWMGEKFDSGFFTVLSQYNPAVADLVNF